MPIDSVSSARPSPRELIEEKAQGPERAAAALPSSPSATPSGIAIRPRRPRPRQRRDRVGDGTELGRCEAALRRLAADVDLQAHRERRQAGRPLRAQPLGDLQAIDRVDPVEGRCDDPRLVALQRADQVPLWTWLEPRQRRDLLRRFLHVVLAEEALARGVRLGDRLDAEGLAHREQRDALHGASGGRTSACNARVHLGELVCDHCVLALRRRAGSASCRTDPALTSRRAMDITQLLAFSVKNKASDLHLSSGLPPMIRVHGDVRRISIDPLEHKQVHDTGVRPSPGNDSQRKNYEETPRVRLLVRDPGPVRAFASAPSTRNRGAERRVPGRFVEDPDPRAAQLPADLRRALAQAARHGAVHRPDRL